MKIKFGTDGWRAIIAKDFTVENEPAICYLHENKVNVKFESLDKPGKIVMYLFDEDKQWSERYEKDINV